MKDPAFLFYSQDYYLGTRTMLPKERAAYIDLMVYQHQYGIIPLNLEKVLMFCSGIDEGTLQETLKAKFIRTEKGWFNEKLKKVIEERSSFKSKLSDSGKIGQFWKKIKASTKASEFKQTKVFLENKSREDILKIIEEINTKYEGSLKGWLKGWLKHIEDENEDENEIHKNIHVKFAHLKITKEDHEKLIKDFGENNVNNIYDDIKNYRLNTKYKSLYLTARKWLNKRGVSSSQDFETFSYQDMLLKRDLNPDAFKNFRPVKFGEEIKYVSLENIKKFNLTIYKPKKE